MTKRPERIILADIFERVSKATYGPDWPKYVATKFRVPEEQVTGQWARSGAPHHVVVLIEMDFVRRLREMAEVQDLFPKPPPKAGPTHH